MGWTEPERGKKGKPKNEGSASKIIRDGGGGVDGRQCWELGIPARSRLYQIEPVGLGTAMVERLSSEIVALAFGHCVTPADLIARELANFAEIPLKSTYRLVGGESGRYFVFLDSRSLNAWGKLTNGFIAALEAGTLMHCFESLTLLPLEGCITSKELIAATRKWCPLCFEERRSKNQRPYEPLIWNLTVVTVCPVHAIDLMEICPGCREKQLPFAGTMQPGRCTNCNEWLGRPSRGQCRQAASSALSEALQVGELIADLQKPGKAKLAQTLNKNVLAIIETTTHGDFTAFRHICDFQGWEFSGFPTERPHLDQLLRICESFGLGLIDLFDASFTPSEHSLKSANSRGSFDGLEPTGAIRRRTHKRSPEELTRARAILEDTLKESPPPKLCTAAHRAGWSRPQSIQKHSPDIFKELKSRAYPVSAADIREQHRRTILSLVPRARDLTVEDAEQLVGLSYIQMCQQHPEEYRLLAGGLRRPHREAVAMRRAKLREFAREVANREIETGIAMSIRHVKAILPNGCMKSGKEISDALREARETRHRRL